MEHLHSSSGLQPTAIVASSHDTDAGTTRQPALLFPQQALETGLSSGALTWNWDQDRWSLYVGLVKRIFQIQSPVLRGVSQCLAPKLVFMALPSDTARSSQMSTGKGVLRGEASSKGRFLGPISRDSVSVCLVCGLGICIS